MPKHRPSKPRWTAAGETGGNLGAVYGIARSGRTCNAPKAQVREHFQCTSGGNLVGKRQPPRPAHCARGRISGPPVASNSPAAHERRVLYRVVNRVSYRTYSGLPICYAAVSEKWLADTNGGNW